MGYRIAKIADRPCLFIFALLCLAVSGCQSTHIEAPTTSAYTYVDSTQYFDSRTASVSMRATFSNDSPSSMRRGYLFQFRTISKTPAFLSSISIVAGGKRFFLEEGQVVLSLQKRLTLALSLEESLEVAKYPSSLLQFKHNNQSYLFNIDLHQLKGFSPQ